MSNNIEPSIPLVMTMNLSLFFFKKFLARISISLFLSLNSLLNSPSLIQIRSKFFLYTLLSMYLVCVGAYLLILPLDNSYYENVIEWNFALLIFLFFPLFSGLLRKTNV